MGEGTRCETHRSSLIDRNCALFPGSVCIRSDAVSTNCPTVAPKPARNALNG